MSPAVMRALRLMLAGKDSEDGEGEIVREGRECWLGYTRIGSGTINQLLCLCAISDVSDGKGMERYAINSTGEALAANPLLESALIQAINMGKPFQIIDGKIALMPDYSQEGGR
jgi:hypothetical protein